MRKTTVIIASCLLIALALCMVACGSNTDETPKSTLLNFEGISFEDLTIDYDDLEHEIVATGVPEGATVDYQNNKATKDGVYNATALVKKEGYNDLSLSAKLTIVMTADTVIKAKNATINSDTQNYDFKINLAGTLDVAGLSGTANANYDGKYRYNSKTNELSFERITSGLLLYDSKEYIYNSGSNKIKITTNEDGVAKKLSIIPQEEEGLTLVNLPFVEIIKHVEANNLSQITKISSGEYEYKANLALASDNKYLNGVLSMLAKMGSTIDMKDVSFSNPASGIDLYFNLSNDKTRLLDYKFQASVSFPIKGVTVTLDLTYEEKANNSKISMPTVSGFVTEQSDIENEIAKINKAVENVKNSNAYSLSVKARNEFDPGWNVIATTDKYYATLYKNTNDGRVDFNHSYEYKTHHEEDGKETYKYTLANIKDGSTYLVSRKGTNVVSPVDGASANDRFDYLVSAAGLSAENVDCIRKEKDGNKVVYHIYMNTTATLSVQNTICDMINSNEAEGVVNVDNYFDSENNVILDSEMVVEIGEEGIVSIEISTDIRYNPTAGEYTETQVTLTDSIVIAFNKELDEASEYVAPNDTKTTLGSFGLNNAKYYIN